MWVKYVWNYYEIMEGLRKKHPELEIESCSGGGGRVDLGVLRYVDEVWPSDNTEAFDRLKIQEGFSEAYAAKFMSAWVTDVPNMNGRSTPLRYRFLVAMQGALGIGSNLNKFSDADTMLATQMVTSINAFGRRCSLGVCTGSFRRARMTRRRMSMCQRMARRRWCLPSGTRSNMIRNLPRSTCRDWNREVFISSRNGTAPC